MAGFTTADRVFTKTHTWGQDKTNDVKVTASRFDSQDTGFEAGLNDLAGYIRDGTLRNFADTGAADAMVVTMLPAPTKYTTGMEVVTQAVAVNTTSVTINVNSLGTQTIYHPGGTALAANEILSAAMVHLVFSSALGGFQIMNPAKLDPGAIGINALTSATSIGATDVIAIYSNGDAGERKATLNALISGRQTINIPAKAMTAHDTAGAGSGTVNLASALTLNTMQFDSATTEYVTFEVWMPKSWDEGTLRAQFEGMHTTATAFVTRMAIQAVSIGAGESYDRNTALSTKVTVDITAGTNLTRYVSSETSAFTVGGTPAENDAIIFTIFRDTAATADTMNQDFHLVGAKIFYEVNASSDT